MPSCVIRPAANSSRTGKLHTLNHQGEFFSVQGPLNIGRTPQGRPILFQAGASEDGKRLAAQHADAIFTHHDTLEQAQDFYQDVKRQLVEQGREPDDLRIFQGVSVIVGDDDADVERQYQETARLVSIENAPQLPRPLLRALRLRPPSAGRALPGHRRSGGKTASAAPPTPSSAAPASATSRCARWRWKPPSPRPVFSGTPEAVADGLQRWFDGEAADGFIISGGTPNAFGHFVDRVVPVLQQRGLFRQAYHGDTLREHLGLKRPLNRFTQ